MANIKNNTDVIVHVGTTPIRPGATVNVDRWDVVKLSDTTKALLSAKAIEEVDVKAEAPKTSEKSK